MELDRLINTHDVSWKWGKRPRRRQIQRNCRPAGRGRGQRQGPWPWTKDMPADRKQPEANPPQAVPRRLQGRQEELLPLAHPVGAGTGLLDLAGGTSSRTCWWVPDTLTMPPAMGGHVCEFGVPVLEDEAGGEKVPKGGMRGSPGFSFRPTAHGRLFSPSIGTEIGILRRLINGRGGSPPE